MPDIFHLGTNLVFPSRFQIQFQKGIPVIRAQHIITGYRLFPPFRHDIDPSLRVLLQESRQHIRTLLRFAFHDSHIGALCYHLIPVTLHFLLNRTSFGKHHQSGCLTVQAVQNEYFIARVAFLQIITEDMVSRPFMHTFRTDRQQTFALVHHDNGIVFINDIQQTVVKLHLSSNITDHHFVAGLYRRVELCNDLVVHQNLPMA